MIDLFFAKNLIRFFMDNNMKHRRLQELDLSDFQIVKEDPDIRGWDIKTASGQDIGEVDELIVDAREEKVRYLVADLNNSKSRQGSRKVLLPIGLATLDQHEDDVLITEQVAAKLDALPTYEQDKLDETVEKQICETLGLNKSSISGHSAHDIISEHYRHDYFNDDNLYKNRLHEAQPARANKDETEYQRGLKLWEQRSQGGIIERGVAEASGGAREATERKAGERSSRSERRAAYEARKSDRNLGSSDREHHRTVEQRIKDEGLQDG